MTETPENSPYNTVPAVKESNKRVSLVILEAVIADIVESFRNCIAPKVPLGELDEELINAEPAELNSNVWFFELFIVIGIVY